MAENVKADKIVLSDGTEITGNDLKSPHWFADIGHIKLSTWTTWERRGKVTFNGGQAPKKLRIDKKPFYVFRIGIDKIDWDRMKERKTKKKQEKNV